MANPFYQYNLSDRRKMLADEGFVRDDHHIWSHTDGRSIGESVATAITDDAFFRFLNIEPPVLELDEPEIDPQSIADITLSELTN